MLVRCAPAYLWIRRKKSWNSAVISWGRGSEAWWFAYIPVAGKYLFTQKLLPDLGIK